MNSFRYQAIEAAASPVEGVIEAEDRKAALQLLGQRGSVSIEPGSRVRRMATAPDSSPRPRTQDGFISAGGSGARKSPRSPAK